MSGSKKFQSLFSALRYFKRSTPKIFCFELKFNLNFKEVKIKKIVCAIEYTIINKVVIPIAYD